MPRRPSLRFYGGFTLTELLCVVAIVGILAGVAIPAINGARASARASKCASNLRQIGVALSLYTTEHTGAYPAVCDLIMDDLTAYLATAKNSRATTLAADLACPCAQFPGINPSVTPPAYSLRALGYGGNPAVFPYSGLSPAPAPLRVASVQRPAEVILMADAGQQSSGGSPRFVSNYFNEFSYPALADPGRANTPVDASRLTAANAWGTGDSLFMPRHQNRGNCLFADGHVALMGAPDIRERNIWRGY